jgi:hypothetical protein
MPEQITKYPEVTMKVLKGAGARCGEGFQQRILTKCPPKSFCALPTGEMCIYGIDEIPQMTQITTQELARVVCPSKESSSTHPSYMSITDVSLLGVTLAIGMVLGVFWHKFKKP